MSHADQIHYRIIQKEIPQLQHLQSHLSPTTKARGVKNGKVWNITVEKTINKKQQLILNSINYNYFKKRLESDVKEKKEKIPKKTSYLSF